MYSIDEDDQKLGQRPSGIHRLIAAQVLTRPEEIAVKDHQGRQLSYRELWRESGRLTGVLQQRGVRRGDSVVIAADRSLELVVAILGVVRAGAWYVLPDPHAPRARQELMVGEVAPKAVVVSSLQPDWTIAADVPRVTLPQPEDGTDPQPRDVDVDPEDTVYVAYTSGSTGRPKGVQAPHRAVVNFMDTPSLVHLTPDDRVASLSSPASDATTLEVLSTLVAGATVVVLPQAMDVGVEEWVAAVREHGVTVMFLMTALFDLIAQEDPGAFSSLDTLMFGGDAPNIDTVRQVCRTAPPRRLVQGYGPTEATVFATAFLCTTQSLAGREQIPLGSALENYNIYVLDEETRSSMAAEQVGELCIGGPGVAKGYLHRPELNSRRFVQYAPEGHRPETIYRSGDLVRLRADGTVEFVGRVDRQVKIRGFRVEPEEVERTVLATGLADAAVVEKTGTGRSGHLVCFYVPVRSDMHLAEGGSDVQRLRTALAERLPGYMLPARWVEIERIPVTSNGKVDRSLLLSGLGQQ